MSDYYMFNGRLYSSDELQHYGVLGMKWGVHRARSKSASNERLSKKALNLDKKAAQLNKKSEKIHAQKDLEQSNRAAIKSANYTKKAAKVDKKALKTQDEFDRVRLEQKAAKLKYKAAKNKIEADRISKTTGYGIEAMKYSIKSDIAAAKAAKARKKIATNQAYIEMMNRKISSLSPEELRGAYAFLNEDKKKKLN